MRLAPLCCLLLLALPLPAESAAPEQLLVSISADVVEGNADLSTAEASGNAVLTRGSVTLRADRITANRATGDVTARGHLVLTQSTRRIRGDAITYNTNTEQGTITNARVVEQGVIVRGERIEFSPQQFVAHHASFTTCPGPTPHYEIAAERITLTAAATTPPGQTPTGGRLSLTRARIFYRGRRIVTLPNYSLNVGQIQQRRASLLPTTGFSRQDGLYTSLSRSFTRLPWTADLNVRLTTNAGLRAFFGARRPVGPATAYVDYFRRQDVGDVDVEGDQITYSTANVLVNREPEIGVRTAQLALPRGLTLTAEVSAGRYSEIDAFDKEERASANRISAGAVVVTQPRQVRPRVTMAYAVGLRESLYSTGDSLTLGYFRATARYTQTEENRLSLSYINRSSGGDSPFLFDAVDVAQELQADIQRRINPAWRLRVIDRYDLDRGRTKDLVLAATRVTDCLEYTFGWRRLRGTFFVGITLLPAPAEAVEDDA